MDCSTRIVDPASLVRGRYCLLERIESRMMLSLVELDISLTPASLPECLELRDSV